MAATQDLNENDLVDRNLIGIPIEPFALSQVGHPRCKPPPSRTVCSRLTGPRR
ncbi:DUF2141 domain-containing protein [Hymenobacter lapidarius]|uniref:DUF2141 domain-containing protein n=1 Tax=Hymenobacter lapidarius TaxID=1908237 RepID=UPI000F7A4FE9